VWMMVDANNKNNNYIRASHPPPIEGAAQQPAADVQSKVNKEVGGDLLKDRASNSY
jgi:hypothetical protein